MPNSLPTRSPPGWTRTRLGTLGAWSSGGTPSKARPDYWLGTIPWVSPKDMKRFVLDDAEDHVSDLAATSGTRLVPSGSVFIVVRGMILAHTFPVCVAARPMAFNQDVKAIVPNGTTDGRFVAHWLSGRSDALLRLVTEATHGTKRLEQAELKAFGLDLPPLPEQRQIAAILDTIDDTIRNTEQIIDKLKQVKQGLLHDLLTCGVDDNGELRDPERRPEHFKNSSLGRIPHGWDATPLGRHLSRCGGFLQTGPFGSQLHSYEYRADGVPVVMPQDIGDEGVSAESVARVPEHVAARLGRHRMKRNDLVFARRGDLSRCAPIAEREEDWLCGTGCLLARLPDHCLDAEWLAAAYRHDAVQRQVAGRAVGSTMVNLNTGILQSLVFGVPPYEEQLAISSVARACVTRIDQETTQHLKLRVLKQGLAQDLLAGRVRVTRLLESAAE